MDALEKRSIRKITDVHKNTSIDLNAICAKAMASDPWMRYENCREMAKDLDRFLADELILGRKIGLVERARHSLRKHPRIVPWAITATIAILCATIVPTFAAIKNHYTILSMQKSGDDALAKNLATIERLRGEIAGVTSKLENSIKEIEANSLAIRERDHQIALAAQAAEAAQVSEANLRKEIADLTSEVSRLSELTKDARAYLKEIENLKTEMAKLELKLAQLPKLQDELKAANDKAKSLEQQNASLSAGMVGLHNSLRHLYLFPSRDQTKSIEHANSMCELEPRNQYIMAIASTWNTEDTPAKQNLLYVATTLSEHAALAASCLIQASTLTSNRDEKKELLNQVIALNGKGIDKHKKIAKSYLEMNEVLESAKRNGQKEKKEK